MVALLTEMHQLVSDLGRDFGARPADQRLALKQAATQRARPRPSVATTRLSRRLGELLGHWRLERRFRHSDGTPRVLAIRGPGVTFSTLAQQFAPDELLDTVVDLICENAEVTRLPDNRLALTGSPVMIMPKNPEIIFASLILRFRRLAETAVTDAAIPAHIRATGLFERVVTGELTDAEFAKFSTMVRQWGQELCERIDTSFTPAQNSSSGTRKHAKTSGIGLYLFRDEADEAD